MLKLSLLLQVMCASHGSPNKLAELTHIRPFVNQSVRVLENQLTQLRLVSLKSAEQPRWLRLRETLCYRLKAEFFLSRNLQFYSKALRNPERSFVISKAESFSQTQVNVSCSLRESCSEISADVAEGNPPEKNVFWWRQTQFARCRLGLPLFAYWLILTVMLLWNHEHSPSVLRSAEYVCVGTTFSHVLGYWVIPHTL